MNCSFRFGLRLESLIVENRLIFKSKFIEGGIKWYMIYGNQGSIEVLVTLPSRANILLLLLHCI